MANRYARQHKQFPQPSSPVHPGLAPTASTAMRIKGLLAAGLTIPEIARVVRASPPAVREWQQGAQPRAAARQRLDDLRRVILILALAGHGGGASGEWLRSRLLPRNRRPLDVIEKNPLEVLAAAEEVLQTAEPFHSTGGAAAQAPVSAFQDLAAPARKHREALAGRSQR